MARLYCRPEREKRTGERTGHDASRGSKAGGAKRGERLFRARRAGGRKEHPGRGRTPAGDAGNEPCHEGKPGQHGKIPAGNPSVLPSGKATGLPRGAVGGGEPYGEVRGPRSGALSSLEGGGSFGSRPSLLPGKRGRGVDFPGERRTPCARTRSRNNPPGGAVGRRNLGTVAADRFLLPGQGRRVPGRWIPQWRERGILLRVPGQRGWRRTRGGREGGQIGAVTASPYSSSSPVSGRSAGTTTRNGASNSVSHRPRLSSATE